MSTISASTTLTTAYSVTGDTTGTLVFKTGATPTTAVTIGSDQSFNFSGTAQRITGDFSNSTISNRAAFQSSTTNGQTILALIPNGTSQISGISAISSSSDPNNSSEGSFAVVGGSDVRFNSSIRGTGTYLPMIFLTSSAERMRVDTSGNVGIGTSSPGVKADIAGVMRSATWSLSGTGVTGGTSAFSAGTVSTDSNWGMYFRAPTSSSAIAEYSFRNSADTERMRINSSGNVGINTASPTQKLSVSGGSLNVTGGQIVAGGTATYSDGTIGQPSLQWNAFSGSAVGAVSIADTTGSIGALYFRNPNGLVGHIDTSGSTTAYVTSSDYRLKDTIAPMTGALAKVALLKPCTYKWKVDGSDGQGFIAHELAEVEAGCVTGEKDAVDAEGNPKYQGIDTSFLVATLTAAIQELKAELDAAKADIATLKGAA